MLHDLSATIPPEFHAGKVVKGSGQRLQLSFSLLDINFPAHTLVVVTFVQSGHQVDLRVDGESVWLSHRSALESIPYATPVVSLATQSVVDGVGGPVRRVAYRGRDMEKLVPSLDQSLPAAPGLCRPVPATFVRTATFRLGHRVVVFRWTDDGCNLLRVTVNGKPSISLVDDHLGDLVAYMMSHPV